MQECARPRPWCARKASDTRHHKIRVGDLCLAVPGSHRASPGEPGGALQARTTVPTRKSARTQSPVVGKGLNVTGGARLTRKENEGPDAARASRRSPSASLVRARGVDGAPEDVLGIAPFSRRPAWRARTCRKRAASSPPARTRMVTRGRRRKPCACAARAHAETLGIISRYIYLTHTAAVHHGSDSGATHDTPAEGCFLTSSTRVAR